jgi:two-component system, LuxR family, sensor kinase FixL
VTLSIVATAATVLLVVSLALLWRSMRLARRLEGARREDAGELAELKGRLATAEADLEHARRQAIDNAQSVGKSDLATAVLHNVGNGLNSVNVAAGLLADRVRNSKSARLHHVVGMFRDHQHDLAAFLGADDRGKKLPEYLAALAAAADEERAYLRLELDTLRKGIGHIMTIISRQQAEAKAVSGVEPIVPSELIEDALKLEAPSLARYEVEIQREHEPLPEVLLDRHKMFQIVINLITNARQALSEAPGPNRLTVRSGRTGDDQLFIEVSDNGIGIRGEHLKSMFSHGFTTKKNGHGFGLHASACAAADMRGRLTVHSDGPGRGATFRLVLPLATVGSAVAEGAAAEGAPTDIARAS